MQLGTCQLGQGGGLLPSTSHQDEVTSTRSTPLPEITNEGQYVKKQFSMTGHQVMKSSETWRWERRDEPCDYDYPGYCCDRVSQPWIQEGNGTQVEPSTKPEWRKQSWDSEKTKWIEFAEQSTWGVKTTRKKNSRDVQRVPLEYLNTDQPKPMWKLPEAGERTTQKNEG